MWWPVDWKTFSRSRNEGFNAFWSENDGLQNWLFPECCFCFPNVDGNAKKLEEVRGEVGIRSRDRMFQEKAWCDVAAWIESKLELQRPTGSDDDNCNEEMLVVVAESGEEKEMGTGQ